jgi:prepilin-type N-terminal cleavage/methylation domain-containing protein
MNQAKKTKGFTLVELVVACTLLLMLSTIATTTTYNFFQATANLKAQYTNIQNIMALHSALVKAKMNYATDLAFQLSVASNPSLASIPATFTIPVFGLTVTVTMSAAVPEIVVGQGISVTDGTHYLNGIVTAVSGTLLTIENISGSPPGSSMGPNSNIYLSQAEAQAEIQRWNIWAQQNDSAGLINRLINPDPNLPIPLAPLNPPPSRSYLPASRNVPVTTMINGNPTTTYVLVQITDINSLLKAYQLTDDGTPTGNIVATIAVGPMLDVTNQVRPTVPTIDWKPGTPQEIQF